MSKTWKLSVRLKPLGVVFSSKYANILYIISKNNLAIVEFWFYPRSTLTYICVNAGWKCYISQTPLHLNKFSTITMQQIKVGNQYRVRYFVNDKKEFDFVSTQTKSVQNVTFYAAHLSLGYTQANAIISDFKLDKFKFQINCA